MTMRFLAAGTLLVMAVSAVPVAAQSTRPCAAEPGFEVTVRGFRAPTGYIRAYLYGNDPAAFLARGRWLQRVEIPVQSLNPLHLCLRAPAPGRYAVSVRHDVDGNRRRIDWSDGAGFSNNPRLSLLNPRPPISSVLVSTGDESVPVDLVLNYRFGLTIRPVS